MAILAIPISKAGRKSISVDTSAVPEAMLMRALEEGLKVLLNAKMSKVKTKDLVDDDLASAQSEAMTIAQKNLDDLLAGKLTKRGSGATKGVPAAQRTEAMRLARIVVKDTIRANGMVPSRVEASVITEAAKRLIESDDTFLAQAKENLEARTVKPSAAIDLSSLGITGESPKLVAKANEAKAERKASLSAKQAGMPAGVVAPRRRGAEARTH